MCRGNTWNDSSATWGLGGTREGNCRCGWHRSPGSLPSPPMPFTRHAEPAALLTSLDATLAPPGEVLLLFFGSEDPDSGESWCPDCVTADPVLRAAIKRLRPDAPCLECPVGVRSAWKQVADHSYRLHPRLRVQRIPTLIHFINGCEVGRLVEGDCADPDAVAAFLAER